MIVTGFVAGIAAITTLVSGAVFKRAFDAYHATRLSVVATSIPPSAAHQVTSSLHVAVETPEEKVREQLERAQLNEIQERQSAQKQAEKLAKIEEIRKSIEKSRFEDSMKANNAIDRLRAQYRTDHGLQDPNAQIPDEWINDRLHEEGIKAIYHGNENGSYTVSPVNSPK